MSEWTLVLLKDFSKIFDFGLPFFLERYSLLKLYFPKKVLQTQGFAQKSLISYLKAFSTLLPSKAS
jgi:hypothetical protein